MANNLNDIFTSLKTAQVKLATHSRAMKDSALAEVAVSIDKTRAEILEANSRDVAKAREAGTKEALIDRLSLNEKRIDGLIESINIIIKQEDPIGKVQTGWNHPNGMKIEKITVPMGVAAIIYESRPNVTVDCAALAYKAGCSILLRGSSSALESNKVLVKAIKAGLANGGGIADAVSLCKSGSRDEVDEILNARGFIDVVLPRGGGELIRRVVQNARIPVIETGEGNCHLYIDKSAIATEKNLSELLEPQVPKENASSEKSGCRKALTCIEIILNAKLQRPGVCNAIETLLLHKDIVSLLMPKIAEVLEGKCELRCDTISKNAIGSIPKDLIVKDATEEDWGKEFLDYILAVKVVNNVDEAISHINKYGTMHSEAILTNDLETAQKFQKEVDASCVYVNASTRFTDGGEFGFGAELGISTQKFHVRGPMGLEALTTMKYIINGNGQIR